MTTLRAGLVGLGAMGRNHARVLGGLDGVELVGIVEPGEPGGRAAPAPVLEDLDELLAAGVDYAVLACPTALHERLGLALAEAGVPALIEKPLAHTAGAAARLAGAFADRGLPAGVGHVERYNPALQQLRARLERGELGEVFQVATRRQGPFPDRVADVGVVKDLATHDVDLTAWVTGSAYVSVAARTVTKTGRPHEDMVTAIGELAGGIVVNHLVNWLSPLKERSVAVTGERGCFVADTLTADLTFYANGVAPTEWEAIRAFRGVSAGDMTRFALGKREPLLVEHEAFRDAVAGDPGRVVTLGDGLRAVQVAEALLRSAAEHVTVTLPAGVPAG